MGKCEWSDSRCEDWGTHTEIDGRKLCGEHHIQAQKIHRMFQRAFKTMERADRGVKGI